MDLEGDPISPIYFKSSPDAARETWQRKNNITTTLNPDSLSGVLDQQEKPWIDNPVYFKKVEMSDLALLKMEIDGSAHECTTASELFRLWNEGSRKAREVVGLLMGKISGDVIIVVDAVALPLEDTETTDVVHSKVINYFETQEKAGGLKNVVGWYRTSILTNFISVSDVETQMRIQELNEHSLAVVIDSFSTTDFGRLRIRAIRTYPKSYKPPVQLPVENLSKRAPPPSLIERTKHLKKCYTMCLTYFKSSLTNVPTDVFQELWEIFWRRLVSLSSNSGSKTEETVDHRVSVDTKENNGGLIESCVHVKSEFTKQYKSITETVDELYVKLVEDVGSSGSMIRAPMKTCFFISLTKEQAKKLADRECVELVRRQYTLRPSSSLALRTSLPYIPTSSTNFK